MGTEYGYFCCKGNLSVELTLSVFYVPSDPNTHPAPEKHWPTNSRCGLQNRYFDLAMHCLDQRSPLYDFGQSMDQRYDTTA